jgi:hypothetical protein
MLNGLGVAVKQKAFKSGRNGSGRVDNAAIRFFKAIFPERMPQGGNGARGV